ncbi:MAG TPA: DUF1178 family protein [Alphaproteobacteria bacterium]|nr:DUF1178 family protein [Alphaproteobacteria bacterium]
MIVFNLQCSEGHGFEAWFKDADAYASQRRARKVACPVCGDAKVSKVPAAPRISKGASKGTEVSDSKEQPPVEDGHERSREYLRALDALQKHVETNCDYVGERFAEEARAIHRGETEERGIYGEATREEAKALTKEGVPFAAIPKRRPKDA